MGIVQIKVPTINKLDELQKLKLKVLKFSKDQLKLMNSPDLWGQWPFLPLRNRGREKSTSFRDTVLGYLVDSHENCKFTVFIGNFWYHDAKFPTERYNSFEAILADGWEVD